jgi:tripartite-type tricarboxylate transporter receptor subunit TctC
MVVAFAPGGPADIVGRLVAKELEGPLGAVFVVENRAGAGGMIGMDYVAKAAPDGYTLTAASAVPQAAGPALWANTPYDANKDFTHVGLVARGPILLMVGAESRFKSFAEVVAAAKAKPDAINFGSGGPGSLGHLTGELAKRIVGFQMQHIPYKGSAPAQTDLLAGQIQVVSDLLPAHAALIRAQRIRPLAIAGTERIDSLPDVPTFIELGYKDLVAYSWFGLAGPAGLPQPIVDKLSAALKTILVKPEVQARLKGLGMEATPQFTPATYAAFVRGEIDKWTGVGKAANIRIQP